MRIRSTPVVALLALLVTLTVACGGGSQPSSNQPGSTATSATPRGPVSLDKNDYPVFPNADAGADPSVPAEQGGKGFTGKGWETNANYDLIGDPRAVKGGVLRDYIADFPGTLRAFGVGPESNSALMYVITPLVYEALLGMHPTTLEYLPAVATHWQISQDKMTYRFRINPNARWSDRQPVTTDDVVSTWGFLMDKGLQDPSNQLTFGKFDRPVAESKYIVRVHSKQLNWRNFLYFSGMSLFPAHVLKNVDGARYLKDYNFKMLPGTGPYLINEADVVKGKNVTIRRRHDYWAETHRRSVGTYNFDEIRETVVRDQNLAFEMLKRGDLDYMLIGISRQWVQDLNFDKVQRGLVQKRKIFNDYPSGVNGLAINTRKPPYDDVRLRVALAHLMNRELLIQKLFFNEYVPLSSYYAGGIYENPNNPKMPYDPQLALRLLTEAGWKDRDAQGRLVKNGQPLTIELLYSDKIAETWMTVYQDDLRKVGIGLNLRLVTPETLFQLIMQRKFDVVDTGWGSLVFPNPETSYASSLADPNNTNNITGFKDKRVDELLGVYDKEFDQRKRAAIIKEIDGILANAHHYVLKWDAPFQRIAYWNKFGHPDGYLTRIGDYTDLPFLWWIDPDKQRQLDQAMRDPSFQLEVGPTENRYWQEFAKKQIPAETQTH